MKQGNNKSIRIIPLGGLGAIGNNMTVFEYMDDILIVDAGIMFSRDDIPGIDFLIPDFSYVKENRHRVKGIVITHGHEDHIGAIPFLLQEICVPIYATKLTLGLVMSRLEERPPKDEPTLIEISPRDRISIGNFLIEFIRVNHSIADCVGLAIETDIGVIIHSGDFKIDYSPVDGLVTDIYQFAKYGEKGVSLLLSDSTNSERRGHTSSESILSEKLIDIFSLSKGRIFVASFASNIHRIQQVLNAAYRYNRKVILSGISMQKNIEIAYKLGYLSYKEGLIIDIKEAYSLPGKKLVVLCTGTQGEPMSALSKMSNGNHKHFRIGEGDTVVISASVIPGNEMMVNDVINSILRMGADVYYEPGEDIHVSGHAFEEELKLMISLTKPEYIMPIHGEYRHLKAYAKIAESLKIKPSKIIIAENGHILELSGKGLKKVGELDLRRIYVDGTETGDIESGIIKDRQVMARDGVIFITVLLSHNKLKMDPMVVAKGFSGYNKQDILEIIGMCVKEELEILLYEGVEVDKMPCLMKNSVINQVFRLTSRSPLVELRIIEDEHSEGI
ncbi:MAG: ribonuclease J [Spirochaetota bacterium]|nr:ribonuclease J [Spirochaetota bacterium]